MEDVPLSSTNLFSALEICSVFWWRRGRRRCRRLRSGLRLWCVVCGFGFYRDNSGGWRHVYRRHNAKLRRSKIRDEESNQTRLSKAASSRIKIKQKQVIEAYSMISHPPSPLTLIYTQYTGTLRPINPLTPTQQTMPVVQIGQKSHLSYASNTRFLLGHSATWPRASET